MNYAGKFDAALSLDGQGLRAPASDHVDSFTAKAHGHVPEGAVVIADPNLIFHGEFKRTGVDLVLSHDGHEFVVHDYFRGDKRAAIASPDGAHLTGDIVSALTGHVQYAQAAPGAAAAQVIGHVTKLTGSATAIRNGVSVILNNGDNVEKGDVVSTGSDSTLGVTFIDGTVFGLSSNARMVLNEMVYDPNGSNNSSLLSLVAGTITFVAGETAKHGDMKIDTPVATMGIRGTAVLTEINFVVPSGGGDPQPQANFQVLVEPNGTTGSYILFDKLTLLPIATVNQAGQMIQISGGNVSVTNALLSPDVQKLITDVFTLKFTDNNTNTKLTTNFTDTITQNGNIVFIKTDTGATATATFTNTVNNGTGPGQGGTDKGGDRFPGPPDARTVDANGNVTTAFKLTEHANATGDADTTGDTVPPDTIIFRVNFIDQNLGDRPTVSVDLDAAPNYVYTDAGNHDVTASLTALQKQDIAATQIKISVVADAGNNNNGSAIGTYTIPDHAFDFLAKGETLTLTYIVSIDDNFAVNPETRHIPITITITGTNDKPVITTDVPTITFSGGTSVPGGPLTSSVPTSGTLSFMDVDLTDTHTVSVALTSASLPGGTVPPGPLAIFQHAMSVLLEKDSTQAGNNTGIIDWSLADLPAYVADFIPKGEVLTLTYTVTLTDSQGATSTQTITVTIKGTDSPAVVWIATKETGAPSGGLWGDKLNWETHTVPTINDDVMVITDQLRGLTPSYPVTIDAAAFAKSLIMDDYNTSPPELINNSTLTIAGALTLNADSKFTNSVGGHVLVGGKIDVEATSRGTGTVTNTSTITNAGTLTLAAGGTIDTRTTISNSGMIDLSGGTLTLKSNVANVDGTLKTDDAGTTLIVDTVTIDGGTVIIAGTLELDGTSVIENGTLNNFATVNVKATTEFAHERITNADTGTIEVLANGVLAIDQSTLGNAGNVKVDAGGELMLNNATITGGTINGTGTIDVTGTSKIDGGATLSTSFVTIDAGQTLTLDDATVSDTAITNGGTVKVDTNSKLTLAGASLTGGTLTVSGTLASSGATTITDASISNSDLIETTLGGLLTLLATIPAAAITNDDTIRANGGELDITGEKIVNTADIKAIGGGILKLSSLTVTNDGGAFTVDGTSKLYLSDTVAINGGQLSNFGHLYGVSGSNSITGAVSNTGTIEVQAGTLNLSGGLTGAGTLIIDDKATLELGGADAQIVTFGGGTDTLKLDKTSHDFTGTIAGQSSSGGTFAITGNADITTSKGDALDFTASDGTSDSRGNIVLTPTGTLGGANNGIVVTQNGIGDISLTTVGDVTGTAGDGIVLHDGATGAGDITATIGGAASGAVGLDIVSHGNSAVTITKDGHITGTASFGIHVDQDDAGAAGSTHITNHGTVVGADGFAAISIQENGTALIDNSGTIGPGAGSVNSTIYAIVETGGAIEINNSGHINGNISVASATFDNEIGGTWTVSGTSVFGTLSTIGNAGEIDLLDGASVSSADGVTFAIANSGKIESWGTNAIAGSITNTNTIEVHTGGTLSLFGSLSGSGSVTIDANATLDVNATVSQTITFHGVGGKLQIDTASFDGSVAGFAATDKIDLSSIKYDGGTSATYDATTGDLVVSDAYGHSITVKLTGQDYSNAHFAGSSDGHGGTLITLNADDDTPAFTAAEASPNVNFSELDNRSGFSALDPASGGTGTIHFTDIDLTDRPTATITAQAVTWLDQTTQLTFSPDEIAALEHALTLQQSGNKNNGAIGWTYSVADSSLDFLGEGQIAKVMSTITLDDHQGGTATAEVTVLITGANDAPTVTSDAAAARGAVTEDAGATLSTGGTLAIQDLDLIDTHTATAVFKSSTSTPHLPGFTDGTSLGSFTIDPAVTELNTDTGNGATLGWHFSLDNSNPVVQSLAQGQSITEIYTVTFTDNHNAQVTQDVTVTINGANDAPTLPSVDAGTLTDTAAPDHFAALTGKLAGTDVDAGETATLTYAAVNAAHHATTTVVGLYGSLTVAADGSYSYVPNDAAINALSAGNYTDSFTVQIEDAHGAIGAATLTVGVTGTDDAPVINVDNISVIQQDDEQIVVHGLKITDADAAAGEIFTLHAATADSGSNVSPSSGAGSLASINTTLGTLTYNEGRGEPSTDKVTLTVADGHGATDTLNLIFNLREEGQENNVALTGTTGKDVFFGTVGPDQFVFAANSNHDTIVNFGPGHDHIDLSAVVTTLDVSAWMSQHVAASPMNSADTLITIDAADTILLKGVIASSLHASDFIVHT